MASLRHLHFVHILILAKNVFVMDFFYIFFIFFLFALWPLLVLTPFASTGQIWHNCKTTLCHPPKPTGWARWVLFWEAAKKPKVTPEELLWLYNLSREQLLVMHFTNLAFMEGWQKRIPQEVLFANKPSLQWNRGAAAPYCGKLFFIWDKEADQV